MKIRNTRSILLMAGSLAPLLYFGTILVASWFYPGYSHARQFASELGARGAPPASAAIFNLGSIAGGGADIAGSLGMFGALRALPANLVVSISTAIVLALFGASEILSGVFPMPDPRHGGFDLGYAILLGPPLLAVAIWKHQDLSGLKLYSIVSGLALGVMFAVLMGAGGFLTPANTGALQRVGALTCYPWIGVASYVLLRRSIRGDATAGRL